LKVEEEANEEVTLLPEPQFQTNKPIAMPLPQALIPADTRLVGASIPVTQKCSMSVLAVGEVTQDGIEKLVAYLNLIKGSFPKDETYRALPPELFEL